MSAAVLIVDDDAGLRQAMADTLEISGFTTVQAGDGMDALRVLQDRSVGLIITDMHMPDLDGQGLLERVRCLNPGLPVLIMTGHGSVDGAVCAMRSGATDYLTKPFEPAALLERVSVFFQNDTVDQDGPVAADRETKSLVELARRVAASDVTVMITGESGTGKEVFARYVHSCSSRANGPFIAINCAAIPEQMLEATLFGYEKGAYTGAQRASPGKFELANAGTLLLDEITEMDLGLQAKMLRVLQEREVERLGGRETIALDVRVLATTNRDPLAEVESGKFREDLFYRLNVFSLHIPPLRERIGDLPDLAARLLGRAASRSAGRRLTLTKQALDRLTSHLWPGNVRELDNVLQRAMVLCPGDRIGAEHLMLESRLPVVSAGEDRCDPDRNAADLKSVEYEAIAETLRAVVGSRKAAAERLGISERTLRYKLARMRDAGFTVPGDRLQTMG